MSVKTAFESGFEKGLKDLSVKLAQELGIEDSAEVLQDLRNKIAEFTSSDALQTAGGVSTLGGGLALDKLLAPKLEAFAAQRNPLSDALSKAQAIIAQKTMENSWNPSGYGSRDFASFLRNEASNKLRDFEKANPKMTMASKVFPGGRAATVGKVLQGAGGITLLGLALKKILEKPRFTE